LRERDIFKLSRQQIIVSRSFNKKKNIKTLKNKEKLLKRINNQNMSLTFFGIKNRYYKNGIWWFTKILNKVVGEDRYDAFRVFRRI
jgi:hypothetical protein